MMRSPCTFSWRVARSGMSAIPRAVNVATRRRDCLGNELANSGFEEVSGTGSVYSERLLEGNIRRARVLPPAKFSSVCQLANPEDEPWWITRAEFLRLEYTAEQVAKLLGITPAMVRHLEKRSLLRSTKGRGTEVYTAREVVRYLKRTTDAQSGSDPTRRPILIDSNVQEAWS